MAFVNFATREITAKIVYYGPGLGGKTTSLQFIHTNLPQDNRGKMISLATEEDRTIYFDFLPLNLGKIQDFAVRVQLYTVPGQVRYNATRKLVLRGADGLVFVSDSQTHKKLADMESYNNMEENLRELGKDLHDLPHVLQFNKIDLPNVMTLEEMNQLLNKFNVPFFETCAVSGVGVLDSLKSITKLVFNDLSKKALLQKKTRTTTGTAAQLSAAGSYLDKPTATVTAAPVSAPAAPMMTPVPAAPKLEKTFVPEYDELTLEEDKPEEMELEPIDLMEKSTLDHANESLQEVEPIAEFDEAPSDDVPYANSALESYVEDDEQSAGSATTAAPFTFQSMFENDHSLAIFMARLEQQIHDDQSEQAVISAKEIYEYLLKNLYPADYVVDKNETMMAFALGIKFRRFVRFKRLLDSKRLNSSQLLFLHHFLCDLYLSLKEL